ncbi:MAG: hypothetical protein ACD_3C00067G0013 [uncultured bacterium (gcode 4)]|uniref:Uncharacterized protein n=1 Tax=uncultured bacterium (gcode 4) TaxID=1234023 RepID=K2GDL8_9BACT|nr:MAG: hypothetical protein ACD_3C00067G0013 [uncultured bacterium (gcode 4)]
MKQNKIIIIFELAINFLRSLWESVFLFFRHLSGSKKTSPLNENRFLDVLNFVLHTGPKGFWKKPTWIKIGRSIATFLHYIFNKEEKFKQIKK